MSDYDDIKKSDIKIINNDNWRFDFRENGYVVIYIYKNGFVKDSNNESKVAHWMMKFHGVDLHTCIAYIFKYYGEKKLIHYDDLDDV